MSRPSAVLLMGATATGKTDLAVKLREQFAVELISVDSALIYRDMNIGTAKPEPELLKQAPHFLIDILDPAESWSAWDFLSQAEMLIHQIQGRGNVPVLVGGTMMYFNALENGMNDLPVSDESLRQQLKSRLQKEGLAALYAELEKIDPDSANRLQPTDTQRILRALEVYQQSGLTMTELLQDQTRGSNISFKKIILDVIDRKPLHDRIERRYHQMLEQGFENEVLQLRSRGDLNLDMPSMRCVGYRQMWQYLDGNYDYDTMVSKGIVATRQLAKRQLTWLRKHEQALRLDYRDFSYDQVCKYLELA